VRDIILSKAVKDYDFATSARTDDLLKIFPSAIRFGEKFGTILVIRNGFNFEITTFRKEEKYSDKRHPDVIEFIDNIDEDLKRRDFTINALAYDFENDRIIDKFGGLEDIRKKSVKCVGNPDDRFMEDALRLMRAVRFALNFGFDIEENTKNSIKKLAFMINDISKERLRDEFLKIIDMPKPSLGIEMLRHLGLLQYIIPELLVCVDVEQNKFHSLDVYKHILLSLDNADKSIRIAALLHDIAKPQTKNGEHFYNHENIGACMAEEILARLKFPKSEISKISKLISLHLFHYTPDWTDAAIRRFLIKVGDDDTLEKLFLLRIADEKGNPISKYQFSNLDALKARIEKVKNENDALSLKDLKVNGDDLLNLGFSRGKEIGDILSKMLDLVIDNPKLNNRKYLLGFAKNKLDYKQ
jgi:putative nucleotidyltransferase with HDIG domain